MVLGGIFSDGSLPHHGSSLPSLTQTSLYYLAQLSRKGATQLESVRRWGDSRPLRRVGELVGALVCPNPPRPKHRMYAGGEGRYRP